MQFYGFVGDDRFCSMLCVFDSFFFFPFSFQIMLYQNKCLSSQLEPNQVGSGSHFSHELSADGNVLQAFILNSHNNQDQSSFPVINESNEEIQVRML